MAKTGTRVNVAKCNRRAAFDLDDVLAIEGGDDYDAETEALQRAIDAGMWGLQGSYGRAMMGAIEAGRCTLGPVGCRDYYGNYIPSRFEVQAGTKGSPEFVADHGVPSVRCPDCNTRLDEGEDACECCGAPRG